MHYVVLTFEVRTAPQSHIWSIVYKLLACWDALDIWDQLHQQFLSTPDLRWLALDITIICAHPVAVGTPKKGGQAAQPLGRSCGGFSTKTHLIMDTLGNPLDFVLTGGERNDVTQAPAFLAGRLTPCAPPYENRKN